MITRILINYFDMITHFLTVISTDHAADHIKNKLQRFFGSFSNKIDKDA